MKLPIINLDGEEVAKADLSDEIFALEPRGDILQRVVRWQLANRQAGTHKSKGRSEIARTGAKLYRQKGTGNARHGSARAPQFRGGGKAFGPVVRSHAHKLNKKVRSLGLRYALSSKAKENQLILLDSVSCDSPKTKDLAMKFEKLGWNSVIIVDASNEEAKASQTNFSKALRNKPNSNILSACGANVYDLLNHKTVVITQAGLTELQARLA